MNWFTVGERVLAAKLNTNLVPIRAIRKTADETVNNSAVLQSDDHLLFAIEASEVWAVQVFLIYQASAVADIKVAWSVPSGATGSHTSMFNAGGPVNTWNATALGTALRQDGAGVAVPVIAMLWATIVNSTTAGTVNLQWAQNSAEATNAQVLTNSWLLGWRLA